MKTAEGKLRYQLVPAHLLEGLALCFEEGAQKYAPGDWKKLDVESLLAAAQRHINAIRKGEIMDSDTKVELRGISVKQLQHAYKAMTSLGMVADLLKEENSLPDPLPVERNGHVNKGE